MVEGGGLENRLRRKVHGGSNPSSSASQNAPGLGRRVRLQDDFDAILLSRKVLYMAGPSSNFTR